MEHDDPRARGLLLAEQERIAARVTKLERDIAALTSARRSSVDDDEHDPDGEPLSARWSLLAGLLESARDDARQAADAVRRLDAGAYGVCVACGQPIPAGQLDVRPFRERCVACTP
ncbi:TraR/DksA family transcriptional regulator [Leucobacter chromiiresistens]|uniref:RNA polymerase-binding transcription factor DksA n=1 Tax=Leucobacter chromiiresistens TaxID=1079994 RepID=A0A1H0ZBB3_9MICO|nr:TraR/DksA C4-type zinc finger protein [Leucobacter chromiiresistens]SDQ24639.1 RNA polymerase-binding transcription factor DksA [Leucobacter chromiiresistens]